MNQVTRYLDAQTFDREQERIFRGPAWHYLGAGDEVANVGEFVTGDVGPTPVVLNRGTEGLHAFVNRCAHRGARVVRERRGRCEKHVCPLHRWTYDHAGKLLDGDPGISLERLRVETGHGLVFGTFDPGAPSLRACLTDSGRRRADGLRGSIRVLSRHRYSIKANWKRYIDMLFETNGMFGLVPLAGTSVETEGHGLTTRWTTYGERDEAGRHRSILEGVELEGGGTVPFFEEHENGMATAVLFVFPAFFLLKIANHLQLRRIVPKSPHEFELHWFNCAYAEDSEHRLEVRQAQGELLGLCNPLSLDEVEELEAGHAALLRNGPDGAPTRRTGAAETPDTPFWRSYHRFMHIPSAGR